MRCDERFGCSVPEWMLKIKAPSKKVKRKLKNVPIERKNISTMSTYDREQIGHKSRWLLSPSKSMQRETKVFALMKEE